MSAVVLRIAKTSICAGELAFEKPSRLLNVGILSLLLFLCIAAVPQGDNNALVEHFQKGQAAAATHEFDRAIAEFKSVLLIDPTVVQARTNLGLMYYSVGDYEHAAEELSRVGREQPNLLPAQLFLGLADLKLGKLTPAVRALQTALHLDPSNVQAARGLLACELESGTYAEALTQLKFFVDKSDEESLYITGQTYLDIGNALTKRLALGYRDSAWAHDLAGDLAAEREDPASAEQEYAKARAKDSSVRPIRLSEHSATMAGLARLLAVPESAEGIYRGIRYSTALGESCFRKLQDRYPESGFAHELRGDVYRLRQDFPSALIEFQAALQKREDDAGLHRSAGEMMIQLGRLDEAKNELQESARLNRNSAETAYLLGQVYSKQSQLDTAADYLKQAVQLDPNLLQAYALLGTAYMHLDKPALAVPNLNRALPLDYYGDLHFQLFKAYRALGQQAAAQKALTRSKQLREKTLNSAVAKIAGAETNPEEQGEPDPKRPAQ